MQSYDYKSDAVEAAEFLNERVIVLRCIVFMVFLVRKVFSVNFALRRPAFPTLTNCREVLVGWAGEL